MSCGHLSENMTDEIVKARGLSIMQKFKKLALLVKTVKLSIYDVNGKIIAEPVKGFMDAGKHYFSFDGSSLSSGIYFYRLQAGNFTDIKRMLLVK